jgi:hypothetical protein
MLSMTLLFLNQAVNHQEPPGFQCPRIIQLGKLHGLQFQTTLQWEQKFNTISLLSLVMCLDYQIKFFLCPPINNLQIIKR